MEMLARFLLGGLIVCLFSLLGDALKPRGFAGLFGAAPAVALAGLTVTLLDKGPHAAHQNAAGMIAGGAGMVAYAAAVVPLLRRVRASAAAAIALTAWTAVAAIVAIPILL